MRLSQLNQHIENDGAVFLNSSGRPQKEKYSKEEQIKKLLFLIFLALLLFSRSHPKFIFCFFF
jgi:hypothetical protein